MSLKLKGVDICRDNGDVDFKMLQRNDISFVMINMGDSFADNVKKAEAAGLPEVDNGKAEGQHFEEGKE